MVMPAASYSDRNGLALGFPQLFLVTMDSDHRSGNGVRECLPLPPGLYARDSIGGSSESVSCSTGRTAQSPAYTAAGFFHDVSFSAVPSGVKHELLLNKL